MPGCAGGRWLVRTPAGATGSPSRPTLGRGDSFDRAIADFSVSYADQSERDYEALVKAVRSGRLPRRPGCSGSTASLEGRYMGDFAQFAPAATQENS